MNKKILFLILLAAIVLPVIAFAAINDPTTMVEKTKDLVIKIGSGVVVIGWIVAGILYLTAAGKPEKITIAKTAMIAAIIGTLLVVIAAFGYEAIKGLITPITGTA